MLNGKITKRNIPLAFASFFLIMAIVFYIAVMNSGSKQAERIVKKLYTVSEEEPVALAASENFSGIFREKFGKDMTKEGMQDAIDLGFPCGLLGGDKVGKVTRAYAVRADVMKEGEEAGRQKYDYQVEVESRYRREVEALAPTKTEMHAGRIYLKRTGILEWKVDKIEIN